MAEKQQKDSPEKDQTQLPDWLGEDEPSSPEIQDQSMESEGLSEPLMEPAEIDEQPEETGEIDESPEEISEVDEHPEEPAEALPEPGEFVEASGETAEPAETAGEPTGNTNSLSDLMESIFIIEGIDDEVSEQTLKVIPIDAEVPLEEPEKEPAELASRSVDFSGNAREEFEAVEEATEAVVEMVPIAREEVEPVAEELSKENLDEAESAPVEDLDEVEEGVLNEDGLTEEEEEEETVSGGIPRVYWMGSIAAGIACLFIFGAIYWKHQGNEEAPIVAKAPAKIVKAPIPAEVDKAPSPAESEKETEIAAAPVTPPAVEKEISAISTPPIGNLFKKLWARKKEPAPEERTEKDNFFGKKLIRFRPRDAILQLHNGNLFPGKIVKEDQSGYLVRTEIGEIFLAREDVAQVLPPGLEENLNTYPPGYVQLSNGNRLWGRIVDKNAENVTVALLNSKMILPSAEVKTIKVGRGYEVMIQLPEIKEE